MFPLITPTEGSGCPLEQELGEALVWGCAFLCLCVPVHEQVHICGVPAWMRFGGGNAGPEWGSGGRLDGTGIVTAHVEGTGSLKDHWGQVMCLILDFPVIAPSVKFSLVTFLL